MNTHTLDTQMVNDVVTHMNEDHSDACLVIVQAIGGHQSCHSAIMQSIDAEGADFLWVSSDGCEHATRILFDKPINRDSQIRGHLVALTKRARAIQNR